MGEMNVATGGSFPNRVDRSDQEHKCDRPGHAFCELAFRCGRERLILAGTIPVGWGLKCLPTEIGSRFEQEDHSNAW